MKEKIKEALKQGRENLGLSDEVFEGVATSAETFIKDEADIEAFCKSAVAESLLKFYQADADRKRSKNKGEGEKQSPKDGDNTPPEPSKQETPDFKAMFEEFAKPLKDEIASLKAERTSESTIKAVQDAIKADGYAQKFSTEREIAWKIAMRNYEKGGKTLNTEELKAEFDDVFGALVKEKGADIKEPFKGEGGNSGDEEAKAKEIIDLLKPKN